MTTKQFIKSTMLTGVILFFAFFSQAEKQWAAQWITSPQVKNNPNTWICFRKEIDLKEVNKKLIASIAVDSKYWVWINENLVVFEGGLKRGPSPDDTYFDEVDIAPYLKKGHNTIAVLVWYFGKEGFSHKSSGKAGLLFDCNTAGISINSDRTWRTLIHPSFLPFEGTQPNYRLPESSLCYDARKSPGEWIKGNYDCSGWYSAKEIGIPPCIPWNRLVLRPIPQWKDSGLREYENNDELPGISTGNPIKCKLPANLQVTPWLKVEADDGQIINIKSDHFNGGSAPNVQAEYITQKGVQEYESFGWMNGEEVIYSIPEGVRILGLKYRATGFNTEFSGNFSCSDDFFNRLWKKSRRTLYVNMRDNYMDCPDRERAQWWGDEVNEGGQAFYAFDTLSHLLFRKGMYELINWQKEDGVIFAPVPAGNWDKELPGQMLASIGFYGFWYYYLYTGDLHTIADLYDGVMRYLSIWKIQQDGTLFYREGGWNWGDWGDQKDMEVLQNAWYYLALKGACNMAMALGNDNDVQNFQKQLASFKIAFNNKFWNGEAYRNPEYTGLTDDRAQALTVVAGLADKAKYPAILKVFAGSEHASPYMEKYVIEALFLMGEDELGLKRMKERFGPMVNDPENSTLWEVWGNSSDGFSGGSTNHAWSGGGLTILSQYVCGISPVEPGFKKFRIAPQPGRLESASARVASVGGVINLSYSNLAETFEMELRVPESTQAIVKIPFEKFTEIKFNGKTIGKEGVLITKNADKFISFSEQKDQAEVVAGKWSFKTCK